MANEKSQSKSTDNVANQGEPKVITARRVSPTSDQPQFGHFTEAEWSDREKEGWTRVDTPVTEFPSGDGASNTAKKSKE